MLRISLRRLHEFDVQCLAIQLWRVLLCCALIGSVLSAASPAIRLKIVEGEGVTYRTGARATRGITILVSDATGAPIENASVTFRLPDQGPGGVFNSGSRTQSVTTGADGLATVFGMQWNKKPGPVEIQISAAKDQAHAGIIATQYLNETIALGASATQTSEPQAGGDGVFTTSHHGHRKLLLAGALVGGAAAAGFALSRSKGTQASSAAATVGAVTIGSPSIIVGQHP